MRFFQNLSPKQKKLVILVLTVIALGGIGLLGYQLKKPKKIELKEVKKKDITNLGEGEGVIEEGLYYKTKKALEQQNEMIQTLKEEIEALRREKEKPKEKIPASEKEKIPGLPPLPEPKPKEKITALPPPPPPVYQPPKETTPKVTLVGGIETVEVKVEKEKKDVKKNKKTIYLPPSFMEATLLSGLDAPTSKSGRRSSIPALFRIKTPAVLPNKVKARLKGCFVIAEGRGELSTERVEMRLVSLSCIDRKGNAVIDQHIKGFVIDEDGKIGLKGYVVAKFGSMIARSMLAGFIEGIGQSTEQAFKDISISPEGVVTSTDKTKDVIGSGIGGGIAGASGATKDFFVELARETYPILEVGNSKPVTIVISEGVELEVKPMKKIGGLEL